MNESDLQLIIFLRPLHCSGSHRG